MRKYWKDNPKDLLKHMKMMHKSQKQISEPELTMIKYVDELNIKHIIPKKQNRQVKGTPDTIIQTTDGHPIALFEDGCYFHGCKCIDWDNVRYDLFENMIKQRHYDKRINKKLTKQGYRVIRIWEHNIYNGNYKKIIDDLIIKYPIIRTKV